jgi:hypothetical protein
MVSSFFSHALHFNGSALTTDILGGLITKGVEVGAEEITRLTTIPEADCLELAAVIGIKDPAAIKAFVDEIQNLGKAFGSVVTTALEAKYDVSAIHPSPI